MPKPYAQLRGLFAVNGVTLTDVGKLINVYDKQNVSHRMTNKTPWKISEMYAIMDHFKIPYSDLHIYFPKDGQGAGV